MSDVAATRSPIRWLLIACIRLYQKTATIRSPRCRFHPTCSSYAIEAISRHGALRGGWLAVARVARCHPWNPGGVDHVPPARTGIDDPGQPRRERAA